MHMVILRQALYVGGLFAQFSLDSDGKYVVDQGGVRQMAATQMALERVNNKTDGVYDHLLPNTQVCLHAQIFCLGLFNNFTAFFCEAQTTGWGQQSSIETRARGGIQSR